MLLAQMATATVTADVLWAYSAYSIHIDVV